jgi:hypothetical protein
MSKRRLIFVVVALIVLGITGVSLYMRNIHQPNTAIREAVKEKDIIDSKYILCKMAATTGFDWLMIKDENGMNTHAYCNIVGEMPFDELVFTRDFSLANNTFIFYIEERKDVYCELNQQDEIEYVVTGWDILYPVRHSEMFFLNLFNSKRYITEKDTIHSPRK